MKKKACFFLFAIVLLPAFLFPLGPISAQDTKTGLQLSPISYEVAANPGENFVKEIKITNVSDKKLKTEISAEDFIAGGEKGEPKILVGEEEGSSKWSLRHWIKFDEAQLELEKKETKSFYFNINIPEDAEPGGHYGVVRFTYSTPQKDDSGVALSGSIGCLVLVKVKGDVKETGKIVEFYPARLLESGQKKTIFFEKGPVDFGLRFKNTGNVHYKPKGTIEITSLLGKKYKVAFDERNVLPDSIRKFDTQWKEAPSFGRFTAQATMEYGDKNVSSKSEKIVFYIFPWKIGIIALIIFVVLFILIWRQIKLSRKIKMMETGRTRRKRRKH